MDDDEEILQSFTFEHLPEHLKVVSAPFGLLAMELHAKLPPCGERSEMLRKLLEAKDCAVRAVVGKSKRTN